MLHSAEYSGVTCCALLQDFLVLQFCQHCARYSTDSPVLHVRQHFAIPLGMSQSTVQFSFHQATTLDALYHSCRAPSAAILAAACSLLLHILNQIDLAMWLPDIVVSASTALHHCTAQHSLDVKNGRKLFA